MKNDPNIRVFTNPGSDSSRGSSADYLNELRAIATEEETPLDRAEQLLDDARFKRVMRMTPSLFAKLSQSERRNFVRWAKHFRDVFTEKARLFERNTKPEPELPAALRAEA